MSLRAGDLRHRLRIESRSLSRDAAGGTLETWTLYAEAWAAIEPLRGREFFAAEGMNAELTTRLRLRYLAGVTPEMRAVGPDGTLYDIKTVIDIGGRGRELELLATASA